MEMWITVLDYSISNIRIYHITDVPTDSEGYPDFDVETWLYNNDPNYKNSQCSWMGSLEKPNVEYKEA